MSDPNLDAEVRAAFAKILVRHCSERGVPQQEMAALLDVSRAHYGHLERGTHGPSLATVVRMAGSLRVKPSELIDEIE